MRSKRHPLKHLREGFQDKNFLGFLERIEGWTAKLLSLAMLVVIVISVYQLLFFIVKELILTSPNEYSTRILFSIFGLFLNVLIAFEILENITAYLKKHVIQVELVIVTSLIAVARKIIILDLEKTTGLDLIALGVAVLALAISYWIIRTNAPSSNGH